MIHVQCCQYWPNGHAEDCPLRSAPERPGGWVPGIGWVAEAEWMQLGDEYDFDGGSLVIVTRWSDGSTPEPPKRLPDVTELREVISSLRLAMTTTSRDQAADRLDAWCYGVIVGWGDEVFDAWDEVAEKHGWSPAELERCKRLHSIIDAVDSPRGELMAAESSVAGAWRMLAAEVDAWLAEDDPDAANAMYAAVVTAAVWFVGQMRESSAADREEIQP